MGSEEIFIINFEPFGLWVYIKMPLPFTVEASGCGAIIPFPFTGKASGYGDIIPSPSTARVGVIFILHCAPSRA